MLNVKHLECAVFDVSFSAMSIHSYQQHFPKYTRHFCMLMCYITYSSGNAMHIHIRLYLQIYGKNTTKNCTRPISKQFLSVFQRKHNQKLVKSYFFI